MVRLGRRTIQFCVLSDLSDLIHEIGDVMAGGWCCIRFIRTRLRPHSASAGHRRDAHIISYIKICQFSRQRAES